MTLATRCTSCGTTFRVVQDQLRVSEGWVRCGRCDTVFDAMGNLIDLDPPAAVEPPTTVRKPRVADPPLPAAESRPIDIQQLLARQDQATSGAPANAGVHHPAPHQQPAEPVAIDKPDTRELAARFRAAGPDGAVVTAPPDTASPSTPITSSTLRPIGPAIAPTPLPTFLREADRDAHWNSPAMRAALAGSSLILLFMLVMQVVYHQRDEIAAQSPPAAAMLRSACARWNCSIEPLRRIGDLSIESSALSKVAGKPQSVRLTMKLRNRGDIDLAMPAVELNLTDAQGKLIARKALLPQDFGADPPVVGAAAAVALQLLLSTGDTRVAGYTVELFYP